MPHHRELLFVVFWLSLTGLVAQPATRAAPLRIGDRLTLESAVLGEERSLNVYLPAGYQPDSAAIYPVIYVLDGGLDEDFLHLAGLVQFYAFPWIATLPPSIVVGIENVDRRRDFTHPSTDGRDRADFPTSGGSAAFTGFLEGEVLPLIGRRYRTDTTVTTLIGQSLGGLLATEILFTRPELFDRYVIVSPSLWWDGERLLDRSPAPLPPSTRVYVAVGAEGHVMERLARQLHVKLMARADPGLRLHFDYLEDRDHGDALHEAVSRAFRKFAAPASPPEFNE